MIPINHIPHNTGPRGAYFVLGDARSTPGAIYGLSPDELRNRFRRDGGWEIACITESVFERRYSRNPAVFAGIIRRG